MKRLLPYLMCALLVSGCLKDELAVPKAPRGAGTTLEACMGPAYQEQVWMDIGSGTVVATNTKTAWDLAFESAPDGWHVYLNGSRLMTAWNIGEAALDVASDTLGMAAGRRIDAPSGDADSTALGDWRTHSDVYLLDLGYTPLGQWMGVRKLRVESVSSTQYTITTALQNGSDVRTWNIQKDASKGFTCFRFDEGVVAIEPPAGTWDLVLTQYTHQFYEPYLPYIVTGALTPAGVRVAEFDAMDPASVTLADTLMNPFSSKRDAIGYDWKVYSFEEASYTVDADRVYIIQDRAGYFYKLRFLDFYSEQGTVGCPRFEVTPL